MSVSRVLSCTVIYLGLPSPTSSSDIHGDPSGGQPYMTDAQSCSGWGLHGTPRYRSVGELLPRPFNLTERQAVTVRLHSRRKPSCRRRYISVALSLKSPSPDVIRHPVLRCSDFPHCQKWPRDRITNSNHYIL